MNESVVHVENMSLIFYSYDDLFSFNYPLTLSEFSCICFSCWAVRATPPLLYLQYPPYDRFHLESPRYALKGHKKSFSDRNSNQAHR
jgi:hypothetical protein